MSNSVEIDRPSAVAADDIATVAALATMAVCTTAVAHEAFGHGSACLILGGHVILLNNAFFRCSTHSPFIDIAGPAGNLLAGLIAFAAQGFIPPARPALRFYALCVMAFSLFWEAGYLFFAMLKDFGDTVFAWRGFVGPTTWTVRVAGMLLGAVAYVVFARMLARRAEAFAGPPVRIPRLFRTAWLTGVAVQILAASFFAPDRLGAVHDAGLSVGAAFPLLLVRPRPAPDAEAALPIARDTRIVGAGACVFILFAATMGRGLY